MELRAIWNNPYIYPYDHR